MSVRIDECKDWADKMEAMASYAKQAKDETLRKTADRIQARAIRRCGELLRTVRPDPKPGRPKNGGSGSPITRSQAAREAGLSRDEKRQALRVANVPAEDFEEAVESDDPPTVTKHLRVDLVQFPFEVLEEAVSQPVVGTGELVQELSQHVRYLLSLRIRLCLVECLPEPLEKFLHCRIPRSHPHTRPGSTPSEPRSTVT